MTCEVWLPSIERWLWLAEWKVEASQEYFWDIFRTRWLRRWHVCVCGVHTVCGDQMKDGCARAAKWKMRPFLGQKRPMFAPPPSVWGNPWTHFSRSDLSLPNRQLLTGYFWLALCSCNCRWMQYFEVTVKCVHRCITDPHIADHNKDIKCKTCLMGTFIAALASQTCQDLGNFQIILDPLCLFVQEGIFNCAMWGLLNK